MKKFLLAAAVIVLLLFIVDKTILKEKGVVEQAGQMQKYDKIEDPEDLPIGLEKGSLAPDFELTDMEGNPVKLSDYRGKAVLLNFGQAGVLHAARKCRIWRSFIKSTKIKNSIFLP